MKFVRIATFVISIEQIEKMFEYLGSYYGRNLGKFVYYRKEATEPKYFKPLVIKEASSLFECKIKGNLAMDDRMMFADELLSSYVSAKYAARLYSGKR